MNISVAKFQDLSKMVIQGQQLDRVGVTSKNKLPLMESVKSPLRGKFTQYLVLLYWGKIAGGAKCQEFCFADSSFVPTSFVQTADLHRVILCYQLLGPWSLGMLKIPIIPIRKK